MDRDPVIRPNSFEPIEKNPDGVRRRRKKRKRSFSFETFFSPPIFAFFERNVFVKRKVNSGFQIFFNREESLDLGQQAG
jgi:hypothetical protein